MTGVRWRDGEAEGQCDYCLEWWPLTVDYWQPKNGVKRCRPCWRLYKAAHERGRKLTQREAMNAAARERYRLMPPEQKFIHAEANRRWKAANREHIAAYNKAYRSRKAA